MAPALVDTHCHLTLDTFQADLNEVVARARTRGVVKILVPGIDIESSRQAIQLTEKFEEVYAACGVHPHAASSWEAGVADELRSLLEHPKVVAIGEIGLDFYRNLSPKEQQIDCFRDQLLLAREYQLPVVVHNRDAAEELFDILLPWRNSLKKPLSKKPGVLHAFTAGETFAEMAIEHDFYLGISGPITYKKAEQLRTLVYNLPIEQLLVETDSPYLSPEPIRGKRNEPANVEWVVKKLADLRGDDLEVIARNTTSNAEILFNWTNGNNRRDLL